MNASTDINDQLLRTVRNTRQIANARNQLKISRRVAHDSFVALSLLDIEYPDVKLLMTCPDLVFMFINPGMLEQVNKLLDIPFETATFKQIVGGLLQVNLIYERHSFQI